MSISRTVLRWGLIGGLAVGGLAILVPEQTQMGIHTVRAKAQQLIGMCIDDPTALRAQIANLTETYPDRIAEIRGEVAEVDMQLADFTHEMDVASRVVAMTTNDLNDLKRLVDRAEVKRNELNDGQSPAVLIRYNGNRFDVNEALTEAHRINDVRQTYKDRLAHSKQQATFLGEQRTRLTEILDRLEREYSTLQTQLVALDREIVAIERNERLIDLTRDQEQTLRKYEKFGQVGSIKEVQSQLARIRTEQEARLQALSKRTVRDSYEERATLELDGAQNGEMLEDPFTDLDEDQNAPAVEPASSRSLAWSGVVIIE
ncbi:MAG: hypothetical protein KC983_05205 [Phycisphaerales bacterium]|nr:hypothetical protein [Phycisphaerales bacterium]